MLSSIARKFCIFRQNDTPASEQQTLLDLERGLSSEPDKSIQNPPRINPLERKLSDEINASLEILNKSKPQYQARQMATFKRTQICMTIVWVVVVGSAVASPALMLTLAKVLGDQLYDRLLPSRRRELTELIAKKTEYDRHNDAVIQQAAPYKKQLEPYWNFLAKADHDLWSPDEKNHLDCLDSYHLFSIANDNCLCWHDEQFSWHGISKTELLKHPLLQSACWYQEHNITRPIEMCERTIEETCQANKKYEPIESIYNGIMNQLISTTMKQYEIEHQKNLISGKEPTWEPISLALFILTFIASVAMLIYYSISYYKFHHEHQNEKLDMMKHDKIQTLIKDPDDAKRINDLAARLDFDLNGITIERWSSLLIKYLQSNEFAYYHQTKETQKAFFQTSFFRQLPMDMRVVVAKEIPNPETPPLRVTLCEPTSFLFAKT